MNIIETKDLTKKFGDVTVVDKLNIHVPKRKVYGFLGPNGAGKTTTMKMLLNLIYPTSGQFMIDGKMIEANQNKYLKDIGALIENPSYYDNLTGRENLKLIQSLASIPTKNVDKVLQITGLTPNADKIVAKYSLGMKQRLGIAMALLKFPKLLILDEPTNGLDPEGIKEIRELIKRLPSEYDMTVLLSSHLLSEIEKTCDHVGIINHGKLLCEKNLAELQGKKLLNIRTSNNDYSFELLKKHFPNHSIRIEENYLKCDVKDDPQIATINKMLVEHEISVYALNNKEETLEDVYFNIIEGDN